MRPLSLILLTGLAMWLPLRDARAQAAGADVRLGNLRDSFQNAFPGQAPTLTGGWTWGAGINIEETYSDGIAAGGGAASSSRPGFYTSATPNLSVTGEGPRLSGSLFYSPQARIYASSPSQNSIFHSFNGTGHLTVVQDLAYVDLRGQTSMQSRLGGVAPNGAGSLATQDQVQTSSLSADSYLVHRFENFGTAQLGYTISQTIIDGANNQVVSPFVTPQANQSLRTITPHFSFTSGDNWGRFQGSLQAQASTNQGQGALSNSSRSNETFNLSYALSRIWTLTSSVGHEKIDYTGTNPIHIDGPTWNGGFTVTPDVNTSLAVTYGQKSGRPSLTVNGSTALSSRIVMSVGYSEILSTSAEDLAGGLANSTVGAGGVSVDSRTGVPIINSNNFNGTQGAVTYSKTANATITWLRNRDTVSFTINRTQSQIVSAAVAGGPAATTGLNGSMSWQHDFSESLQGNIFTQWGQRSATSTTRTNANQTTMTGFAGLSYALSQTLSTHFSASYTTTTSPLGNQRPNTTTVVVGLSKNF